MKKDPPGGCFGHRVDRLMRACQWSRRQADQEFGYRGKSYSPVERVRIGGHAAPAFVTRLRQLEQEYDLELQRLRAVEKRDVREIRRLDVWLAARQERRRRTVLGQAGSVSAEDPSRDAAGGIREVLYVSRSGRVVARESVESWLARYASPRDGAPPDDEAAEGEV